MDWIRHRLITDPDLLLDKMARAVPTGGATRSLVDFLVAVLPNLRSGRTGAAEDVRTWLIELICDWPSETIETKLTELLTDDDVLAAIVEGAYQVLSYGRLEPNFTTVRHVALTAVRQRFTAALSEPLAMDSPLPRLLYLASHLDDVTGEAPAVQRWLAAELDVREWSTLDLAASFVEVIPGKPSKLANLDIGALGRLVPLGTVIAELERELEHVHPEDRPDPADLSLDSRRQHALVALAQAARDHIDPSPSVDAATIADYAPGRRAWTWKGIESDLVIRAAALVAGGSAPVPDEDEFVKGLLATNAPLAELTSHLSDAFLDGEPTWTPLGGEAPGSFAASYPTSSVDRPAAAAHVAIGPVTTVANQLHTLVIVDVAFDLLHLNDDRTPKSPPHKASLGAAPAAFSIEELRSWLEQTLTCTTALTSTAVPGQEFGTIGLWVQLNGCVMRNVVQVEGIARLDSSSDHSLFERAESLPLSSAWDMQPERTFARAMVGHMLRRSGYRNYQSALLTGPPRNRRDHW